jgi:hypothetical protein
MPDPMPPTPDRRTPPPPPRLVQPGPPLPPPDWRDTSRVLRFDRRVRLWKALLEIEYMSRMYDDDVVC